MSGTVESFSGPRPPHQQTTILPSRKHPRSPKVEPEDCRSVCDLSSSYVVEDGDCEGDNDNIISSSFRKSSFIILTFFRQWMMFMLVQMIFTAQHYVFEGKRFQSFILQSFETPFGYPVYLIMA
ncbi:hypothetical protein KY290_031390 [Solanum tuberosum]|uniref:Uncharacterized protein n=1 Tax=Solanum tuberosum TaxID=4113 RepID=A0ABQ7U910_SOLTU|nr:hypothetical protein KY289_030780 [Solanum tuberosum]KAH0743397.1 hypothetical protein KY290_031390 [Solanum tuberosum]